MGISDAIFLFSITDNNSDFAQADLKSTWILIWPVTIFMFLVLCFTFIQDHSSNRQDQRVPATNHAEEINIEMDKVGACSARVNGDCSSPSSRRYMGNASKDVNLYVNPLCDEASDLFCSAPLFQYKATPLPQFFLYFFCRHDWIERDTYMNMQIQGVCPNMVKLWEP